MIKESAFKKFALVFGILCSVGFVVCLAFAVKLPTRVVYDTVFGTVAASTPGSFNLEYLSSIIILAMGAYVGFSIFACIKPGERKVRSAAYSRNMDKDTCKEEKKEEIEESVNTEKEE